MPYEKIEGLLRRREPLAPRRLAGLALAALAVLLGSNAATRAGGSVPLDDVMGATRSAAGLSAEISSRLSASRSNAEEVTCDATRLGRHWEHLGGARVAPYTCHIGSEVLEINAKQTFLDERGTQLNASDPQLSAQTRSIRESEFTWSWRPAQ